MKKLALIILSIILIKVSYQSEIYSQIKSGFTVNTEINALLTTVQDYQVNENSGTNNAIKFKPSIAADKNGKFVIVWMDERNGFFDIFAQRFMNDGTPIGDNFAVNDIKGEMIDNQAPSISMDDVGNFVVAWGDERNGNMDIYIQRYSYNGIALGNNTQVNFDEQGADQSNPVVSMDKEGNFVVVWVDYSSGGNYVFNYGQCFSNDGTPLGYFSVSRYGGTANRQDLSVATDREGNFIIAWSDKGYSSNWNIRVRKFSKDGTPLFNDTTVNDYSYIGFHEKPFVAVNDSGNFLVTWKCMDKIRRSDKNTIYVQRFSQDGEKVGNNIKVSENESRNLINPNALIENDGVFFVTWLDSCIDKWAIYYQRYSSEGIAIGNNLKLNDGNEGNTAPLYFHTSHCESKDFVIVWEDRRNSPDLYREKGGEIFAQKYSSDFSPIGSNIKITDDIKSTNQISPSISTDADGNYIISWTDYRNNNFGDIYAQRFLNNGTLIGDNFKVNDDQKNADQLSPSIATDKKGGFIITWSDFRNENWDIFAQRFSNNGSPIGINLKVNDKDSIDQVSPSIATDENGNFVITWVRRITDWFWLYSTYGNIYARCFFSDGSPMGNSFKVNEGNLESSRQQSPSVSMDNNGNFVIVWLDDENNLYGDIYTQRYSSNGTPIGNNFLVNNNDDSYKYYPFKYYPSISMNEDGRFVIVWVNYCRGFSREEFYMDVLAQVFSNNGSPIGNNLIVNTNKTYNIIKSLPSVSIDKSGNFVIIWEERPISNYSNVIGQRYSSDINPLGNNFQVTNSEGSFQLSPNVELHNNMIYNTWQDNRIEGTGFDIWANVLDWYNPTIDVRDELSSKICVSHVLHQNYPNPFNSLTKISYFIPISNVVTLRVFNMLGHEIQTLVNKFQEAGIHSVDFSANNLSSGIYIYKIQVGDFIKIKKMLFLK